MKTAQHSKRRVQGKLKRITMADRYRKREHNERTGRYDRLRARNKVVPSGR